MSAFHPLRTSRFQPIADIAVTGHLRVVLSRSPRGGEVCAIQAEGGKSVIAIVRRSDGLYECYEDFLSHDDDEGLDFWSLASSPLTGLYSSPEEAEREVASRT